MPGPISSPRIILLDARTGTTAGPSIGIQGDALAFTGSRCMDIPVEINVILNGGTSATVVIETDSDIAFGTAVTWTTLSLTSTSPSRKIVGRLKNIYVRARPSANVGGGNIDAYVKIGV